MKTVALLIGTVAFLVIGFSQVAMATMSYQCWNYPDGHPDKMVYVTANSNDEAVQLAVEKFKRLGAKGVVKCK